MKKFILSLFVFAFALSNSAQLVAKVQLKEKIKGICNKKEVYAILPGMDGQKKAKCPVSKDSILKRLNAEVTYLHDKADYSDKGMLGIFINCKGEVVQCKMDNKTKNSELDAQIEAVFNSLGTWKAAKVSNEEVDSQVLYAIKIENGKFVSVD